VDIIEFIMWYVTLDGHFTKLLGHHFTLLNHFIHGFLFFSLPFFLLTSVEGLIYAHMKNKRAIVLHKGLILLIMEHAKAHIPNKAIKGKWFFLSDESPSTSSNTNVIGAKEWNGEVDEG
jgi:hypothetical protein